MRPAGFERRLILVANELAAHPESYDDLIDKLVNVWLLAGLLVM